MTKYSVPTTIAVLCILSLAGIALLLQKISIDQSSTIEQMLSKKDAAQVHKYRALFGVESEPVIIAIQSHGPVATNRITEIETSLLAIPGVSNAISSASAAKFGAGGTRLFSPDDSTELIVLMIAPDSQQLASAKQLSQEIEQTIDGLLTTQETAIISGVPQIRAASWEISNADIRIILPLLVVITLVVTQLFFHSPVALGLSLLLTSMTTCICLALQLLHNAEINALVILVVPVIWAISTLDAFHLYSRTALKYRQGHPHPAKAASRELFIPCLLTTATTAGCFLTLTFLDTSALIVSFGVWGCAGAIIAFILTFSLGEKMLARQTINNRAPRWPGLFALTITRLAQRYRIATIFLWASLATCSAFSMSQIEIATSFPQVFAAGSRMAANINHLKALTGTDLNALDIIIEASDDRGKSDERLASAAVLTHNYLNTIDETQLVLPLGLMDESFITGEYQQWQAERNTPQGLDTATYELLGNWVNKTQHTVRLQAHFAPISYTRKAELANWLAHFDETMLGHHTLTLSGSGYFYYLTEQRGLNSLLASSILSLLIVSATMLWITRSKLQALVAVFSSIVPAALLAGCMALLSVPWSIAMLPMPAVLLGLMNDDTIHMLWSSQKSERFGRRYFQRNALAAGPALLATTVVLAGAVGTLGVSGLQTNQSLGWLIPLGLVLALLCNLTLLPALSSLLHKSTRSR